MLICVSANTRAVLKEVQDLLNSLAGNLLILKAIDLALSSFS
jgi:hypothetical protein